MNTKKPKRTTQLKVKTDIRAGIDISLKRTGDLPTMNVPRPEGPGSPSYPDLTIEGYS